MSKSRREVVICAVVLPLLIFLANFLIVRKLFVVEFTPYLFSTEGLFTTIARAVATYPFDLQWWPLWECGVPFQNSYQPMLPVAAGLYSHLTGVSPALSIHQCGAALFCIGPVFLYLMAWKMTGRPGTSFLASLAYSAISPCAWISTTIRQDLGGLWRLRRLQILAFYGEGPHTSAIALVPLAILFLYLGASRKKLWPGIAAGLVIGPAVLFNTFAAVIVGLAGLCLFATVATESRWKYLGFLVAVGALTYAWISPLSPPSVVAAIRVNSHTVEGDYRFNERSLVGVVILATGFLVLHWLLRKWGTSQLRFFILLAFLTSGIVVLGTAHNVRGAATPPLPDRGGYGDLPVVCLRGRGALTSQTSPLVGGRHSPVSTNGGWSPVQRSIWPRSDQAHRRDHNVHVPDFPLARRSLRQPARDGSRFVFLLLQ